MTKSYTGGHPLESVVGDIAKERDAALARAEAAERRVAELEEQLARCLATDHARFYHLWQARAEAAERRVAELEAAAHVPDDYEYGLESWINQHLYAAYIGARFSDSVMEQIRNSRLTFPEAPVYADLAAAQARLAEQEWRPVTGDDLPEDHDEALVTVENDDGYRFVDMAEFTVGGVWWQRVEEGWRELKRVTHWRPLPPPPAATESPR